jgi:hypothetical protein
MKSVEVADMKFEKRPIEDILKDAKTIDPEKIAQEVLLWIIANVENFIDNQNRIFKLDLVLDKAEGTEETKRLQDLYRAIPDDEETNKKILEKAEKCRRILDEITKKAFEHIKALKDLQDVLFKRMVFYYERVIPSSENKIKAKEIDEELKALFLKKEKAKGKDKDKIQIEIVAKISEGEKLVKFEELEGRAFITNLEYEAFSMGVRISEGVNPDNPDKERQTLKTYNIPEGFTCWVEITYKHKQRPTVMF